MNLPFKLLIKRYLYKRRCLKGIDKLLDDLIKEERIYFRAFELWEVAHKDKMIHEGTPVYNFFDVESRRLEHRIRILREIRKEVTTLSVIFSVKKEVDIPYITDNF
ncbi:MAG TPA: hypothetical protein ENI23_14265 [bacterium]|nr:hypothetical protein [bacterium]